MGPELDGGKPGEGRQQDQPGNQDDEDPCESGVWPNVRVRGADEDEEKSP